MLRAMRRRNQLKQRNGIDFPPRRNASPDVHVRNFDGSSDGNAPSGTREIQRDSVPGRGGNCYPCVRYVLSAMPRAAHTTPAGILPQVGVISICRRARSRGRTRRGTMALSHVATPRAAGRSDVIVRARRGGLQSCRATNSGVGSFVHSTWHVVCSRTARTSQRTARQFRGDVDPSPIASMPPHRPQRAAPNARVLSRRNA